MRTMRCDRRCDSSTSYKQLAQASRSKGFVLDLPPYNSFPSTGSRVIQALSSCSCCGSCSSSFVSFQVFESLLYSRSPFSDRPSVDLTPPGLQFTFSRHLAFDYRRYLSSSHLRFWVAPCVPCAETTVVYRHINMGDRAQRQPSGLRVAASTAPWILVRK